MTDDLVERLRDLGIRSANLAADRIEALTARAEAAEARDKECHERWIDCQEKRMALIADAARLRAACAPFGSAMYFMDDSASDEDVCIISAKTVKYIRAALKGGQP